MLFVRKKKSVLGSKSLLSYSCAKLKTLGPSFALKYDDARLRGSLIAIIRVQKYRFNAYQKTPCN